MGRRQKQIQKQKKETERQRQNFGKVEWSKREKIGQIEQKKTIGNCSREEWREKIQNKQEKKIILEVISTTVDSSVELFSMEKIEEKNRQNKKRREGRVDEARTDIKIEVRERKKRNGKENCRDDHRKRHIRMG